MRGRLDPAPSGLAGVEPKLPIGVKVNAGMKGPTGAPVGKDRFWLVTPHAGARSFKAGERTYAGIASFPHGAFTAWNDGARDGMQQKQPPGRFATLKGMIVHSALPDAARWNRGAQKLPEPHPNPPSMRPACSGNGIAALRYSGEKSGEEQYEEIACPNEGCIFAQSRACKPAAHLVFMLRWNREDPFEHSFPALLALYSTHSWNTLKSLMGLFELVLGTEAVAPWMPRESWQPGLAAELGIENPSLFGLPFTMTLSEKSQPQKNRRFPTINFSPDGDLGLWLMGQKQQREALAGSPERRLLGPKPVSARDIDSSPDLPGNESGACLVIPPASISDPDVRDLCDAASTELDPTIRIDAGGPARLTEDEVDALRATAREKGVNWTAVEELYGGPLVEFDPPPGSGDLYDGVLRDIDGLAAQAKIEHGQATLFGEED